MPHVTDEKITRVVGLVERELLPGLIEEVAVDAMIIEIADCALAGEAIVVGNVKRLIGTVRSRVMLAPADGDGGGNLVLSERTIPIFVERRESEVLLPPEKTPLQLSE